jgi:hypothetical protein
MYLRRFVNPADFGTLKHQEKYRSLLLYEIPLTVNYYSSDFSLLSKNEIKIIKSPACLSVFLCVYLCVCVCPLINIEPPSRF